MKGVLSEKDRARWGEWRKGEWRIVVRNPESEDKIRQEVQVQGGVRPGETGRMLGGWSKWRREGTMG